LHHVFVDIADWEPEPEQWWRDAALGWLLPGRDMMEPDLDEPGRFVYGNPAAEALAQFIYRLDPEEFGCWFDMAMAGALFLRQWLRDHRARGLAKPLLRQARLILRALLAPLILLLALLRSVPPEPGQPRRSGRADDAILRFPSAPLVRAHAILTAAPPSSRAPVPAGVPA
jgi:hypothetical protein